MQSLCEVSEKVWQERRQAARVLWLVVRLPSGTEALPELRRVKLLLIAPLRYSSS